MSLFSISAKSLFLALSLLGLGSAVSGCSFSAVYGDAEMARSSYALQFAEPDSRLEQIIYQELALRFPASPDAPQLKVRTKQATGSVTRSDTNSPLVNKEVTVTATITLVSAEGTLLNATRFATASYTTNGQALADHAAEDEAAERAARSLAETIRLTVIAALSQ